MLLDRFVFAPYPFASCQGRPRLLSPFDGGDWRSLFNWVRPLYSFGRERTGTPERGKRAFAVRTDVRGGTRFSLRVSKTLLRDLVYAVTSPARWDGKDWLILGAGVAAVAAVSLADGDVRTQVQHIQNTSANNVAGQIRQFGGPYSYGVLGLFLAGGEVFDNGPAKAVFIDGAGATLVSGGIALGLKYVVGRNRPPAEKGNSYFQPFSNSAASFPSGETTQAFAVGSVIASHYDEWWIKGASYGIASLVGMARIYEDAHWTSDALAGALIGTAVGTAIAHFNDKRRSKGEKKTEFFVTPLIATNTTGIGIIVIY